MILADFQICISAPLKSNMFFYYAMTIYIPYFSNQIKFDLKGINNVWIRNFFCFLNYWRNILSNIS